MRLALLGTLVLPMAASAQIDPATLRRSSFTWTQAEREYGFRHWDSVYRGRNVAAGGQVHQLPMGRPLVGLTELDPYLMEQKVAGLIVLQDGKIRLERYGLGYGPQGRWTSQSVAKSVTSTLVGVALKDGFIKSIDDLVTTYLPGLRGSGYDSVTIRQLMTMTSGVKWNEDYNDPKSDVARFYADSVAPGLTATVSYMRKLTSEAPPGTKWVYKTGETHLLGEVVMAATGQSLAEYLSKKIWRPYGMERDADWTTDRSGHEFAGCCLQVSLRDYARFGQFVLEGGKISGRPIVPKGWFEAATHRQVGVSGPFGYGFQWWTNDDGSFDGYGIHGQLLHIDPARQLVIAMNSAWPEATSQERTVERRKLINRIAALVDKRGPTFHNPLNSDHGSDPWMQYYEGEYYLTATTWSASASVGITMKHGRTIAELIAATPVTIWSDTTASRCCNVWAPEFHLLKGPHGRHWYLYYVAGPANCCAKQYIHVLESAGTNPLGPYAYMGRLFDPANDNWAVDPTVLELKGKLYLLWSGYAGALFRSNQDIYMMAMRDPWTLTGSRALISEPTLAWETGTAPVNEAPEILSHGGVTWLVFSATWCGNPGYKLGTSRYQGGDPLRQEAWVKDPNPVFQAANGQFSTAHNGFFTSPDGREDWIVYHGTTSPKGACDNTRTTRIQKLTWNAAGTPNFGAPLDLGTGIPVPSGERRRP